MTSDVFLPDDVQAECLAIMRGYERRKWSRLPGNQQRVMAVQNAFSSVGPDLPEDMRAQLREGIKENCLNGRKNPFERLGIAFISRSEFYRRKRRFLLEMAVQLDIASLADGE